MQDVEEPQFSSESERDSPQVRIKTDPDMTWPLDLPGNQKVWCKLCNYAYDFGHMEAHVTGVHGVDGPREAYIQIQLEHSSEKGLSSTFCSDEMLQIFSEECKEDDDTEIQITYVKKAHSGKTNVKVYIEKDTNAARDMYEIQINKASNVTLFDVKQHLMSNRRRYYKHFDSKMYDYSVNTLDFIDGERLEGSKDLDENNEMTEVLPLFGDIIILNCWLKT